MPIPSGGSAPCAGTVPRNPRSAERDPNRCIASHRSRADCIYSFSAEDDTPGLLLSNTPTVPLRVPYTPSLHARPEAMSVASRTANASVALPTGGCSLTYFVPSSHVQAHDANDGELSDVDFISEYALSESDANRGVLEFVLRLIVPGSTGFTP